MVSKPHYVVNKLYRWSDIVIEVNGVDLPLYQPKDSKVVGFMPVYKDLEAAVDAAGNVYMINALLIGPRADNQEAEEEEPDGDDTEES